MKISSTKKAAILATVLGGFMLSASAEAAKLGIVTASDYVTSHMGALEGSFINSNDISAVKSVITGLNRDPAVYNTVDPITGKSSLYIRQYNYSTTNLQNSYAFDAQGNWQNVVAGNTSGAVNAHDVVRYKDFVYVASYDEGTIGIAKVTGTAINDNPGLTVNLKQDLIDYAGIQFGSKAQLHGEGIVIIDNILYVIANVNPQGGYKPYDPSYLMKYVIQEDGSLSYDGYVQMGKNTDSVAMNVYNNHILTTAIGGYQNYGADKTNEETSIDIATLHTKNGNLLSSTKVVVPDNVTSECRSLKILPNGTAYVMTYNIGTGGDNVDVYVYQTTVSNLLSKNPTAWKEIYSQKGAPGWFGRLDAEYNTNRLWVQVGNKLNIYTDGATTPLTFGTSDFSTSSLYNELYTWDIIRTDVIPEGRLVTIQAKQLNKGEVLSDANDAVVIWKDDGNNITAIKNKVTTTVNTSDNVISLGVKEEGNLVNNVLAGIYAEGISSNVNADNGLQIQVNNNVASPVGIYATDAGLKITAKNGDLDILTKSMEGGNSLTNAIWLDSTIVGGDSITITANATNITMEGGYGGNGVAITKTNRWGENSKESAMGGNITIKGDLNIKGATKEDWGIGANPENVISRFNNAGIYVDVNNSKVEVKGNVDMDIYGNGVTVNGKNSTVTIEKGGSITVPTGTDYGYYTLAAYEGTINMNKAAGDNTVQLNGDIFALKGATINLGLATADSYIKGIIDNGGTVNLTLKNGATWTNEANNTRYEQDNEDVGNGEKSHITKLTGGDSFTYAGTIVQTANSKLLEIDNLAGAIKINYNSYNADAPSNIAGGDVVIGKAAKNSQVGLYTNNTKAINTSDEEAVKEVLEALAKKLYYTAYTKGENNLNAVAVGITEGMVSSSVEAKINFDANGQGSIDEELSEGNTGGDIGDDEDVEAPVFTGADDKIGASWDDNAANQNGLSYTDGNSSSIKLAQKSTENVQNIAANDATAIYVTDGSSVSITAGVNRKNYDLNILTNTTSKGGRANAVLLDTTVGGEKLTFTVGSIEYNNIKITMLGGNGGNGFYITNSNESKASENGGTIEITGDITIKGATTNDWGIGFNADAQDARDNSAGILIDADNSTFNLKNGSIYMDVCGNGITVDGTNSEVIIGSTSRMNSGSNGTGKNANCASRIFVPEGDSEHKFYSLAAYEGSIYFDILKDKAEQNNYHDANAQSNSSSGINVRHGGRLTGDVYVGSEDALIEMALRGGTAYLKGAIINNDGGTANLCLLDGATWTNTSTNGEVGMVSQVSKFYGSKLINGGEASIQQMANSGDIIIDNYSGSSRVYYTHDADKPYIINGGNIIINNAAVDSKITLHTNYTNAITWENVEYVLGNLANKLYYLGYIYQKDEEGNIITDEDGNPVHADGTGGLTATLAIGEGMTASAINVELLKNAGIIDNKNNISSEINNVKYDTTYGTLNAGVVFDAQTGKGSIADIYNAPEEDGVIPDKDDIIVDEDFRTAEGVYTKPIYGKASKDLNYIGVGVLENGIYTFDDDVVFNIDNISIDSGPYHRNISTAITVRGDINSTNVIYKAQVDMQGNDLTITNDSTRLGSGASISAINRGVLEINNPGDITIYENGMGPCAGIFANGGGKVIIDNAATNSTVTITTSAGGGTYSESYNKEGAGIKTMNGADGCRSEVIITGDVNIVADLQLCNNEALSAVASTIEVGGGHLEAKNGAWCAIRAYGEFVSDNAAVVNVNVKKDTDGNIIGAGERKTTIIGDFVTNGGMGTLGYITVGLSGDESSWVGNYGDNRGYGVTKGQEGNITLYMKDGANWTGFSDGEMNVTMEGYGTTWYGFNVAERQADDVGNINGGLSLTLTDGALWVNAISKEQKYNGTVIDSKVYNFIGDGGYIDMTGEKRFIGHNDASHAEGSNGVSNQNTSIEQIGAGETGNLKITNYSGNTTIFYKQVDSKIIGGTTTIEHAEKGSKITLSTNNTGINTGNVTKVSEVLNNLANKLYYTNYINGERNLQGYVQIAEGLTASTIGTDIQKGDIAFSTKDGQGSLKDGSLNMDTPSGGGNQGGTTPDVPGGDEPTTPDTPSTPEIPVEPEEKVEVEIKLETGITGATLKDGVLNLGDTKDDKGNDADSVIVEIKESTADNANNSAIVGTDVDGIAKPVVIEMGGKDLTIGTSAIGDDSVANGIHAQGADVTINNASDVTIKASATGGNSVASAIYAKGNDVTIDNGANGIVTLKAENKDGGVAVLNAESNANVEITGKVNITGIGEGNVAVNVGEGSTVNIGGGIIGDKATGEINNVTIVVSKDGAIAINATGKNDVIVNGDIVLGTASRALMMMSSGTEETVTVTPSSINLTTAHSQHNGDVRFNGGTDDNNQFVATITGGANWNGNSIGGVALDVVLSDSGAWTGYHDDSASGSAFNLRITNGAEWENTAKDATLIDQLVGAAADKKEGFIRMSNNSDANLTVENYSGKTTFIFRHDANNVIQGGTVTINKADDGSIVNARTNSIGTSNTDEVKTVLEALAARMIAGNDAKNVLKGEAQIAEGMVTSAYALKVGEIDFTNGTGALKDGSLRAEYDDSDYIYGDSETAMMKGAKSAMASTVMMWRSESNDLLQRMGDLRMATEEGGVWAKYYGGKYEMDAQKTKFNTSYSAYQAGYDKEVGDGWRVGLAVSHNDGNSTYDLGGKGDMTVTSLSVYGTKDYEDGRYLGLIVKGSSLKNEYEVFNNDGYKLEGDFKTWGTSISAEYGKRIEKANGFYFDPSVELTIGHVQGKSYTAHSDLLKAYYNQDCTMQVEQDSYNSVVGRIGFGIGQKLDKASYYAKLALAHEFAGDFETTYTAEETKGTSISFGDTWCEMQLGGTAKLSDNSLVYATYERSFGGDVTEKWRIDAGLRFSF